MRRLLLVVTVALFMAAMLVATALPAFAAVRPFLSCGFETSTDDVIPGKVTGGITPSGNANSTCHVNPKESNKGGSGGGGATVDHDFRVFLDNQEVEGHLVETPSGNIISSGHFHPNQQ